jgi:formylglycine-generating enzyme required for sulfatase activity
MRASLSIVRDEDENRFRFVRYAQGLGHDGELLFDLWGATVGIEYVPENVHPSEVFYLVAGREKWPATQVTYFAARSYCEAAGKRLPTDDEWEAAARGPERRPYPWGSSPIACGRVTVPPDGLSASEPGCPATTAPRDVGTSIQDVTPEGVFDMAGNAAEWTDSVLPSGGAAPPGGLQARATRGGSYYGSLGARVAVRGEHLPNGAGPNGGFRCAMSLPSP